MKLSKVLPLFAVVAMFALSSCNKETCYTCTHSDTTIESYTICEDEAGGETELEAAVVLAEGLAGYDCSKN